MRKNANSFAPFGARKLLPGMLAIGVFLVAYTPLVSPTRAAPAPKVKVCHIPPGNPANFHTIKVGESALSSHLAHGDFAGPCDDLCSVICDDGNACTIDDTGDCEDNGCPTSPEAVDCNDGEACTMDTCEPATGCEYTPVSGTCVVSGPGDCELDTGVCSAGSCQPDPRPGCCTETPECEAVDEDRCTIEHCLPCATENCIGKTCQEVSEIECQTDACHLTVCVDGECTPPEMIDCDDDNFCTEDSCDPDSGFPCNETPPGLVLDGVDWAATQAAGIDVLLACISEADALFRAEGCLGSTIPNCTNPLADPACDDCILTGAAASCETCNGLITDEYIGSCPTISFPTCGTTSDPCRHEVLPDCCLTSEDCYDGNNCTEDVCNGVDGCDFPSCASGDACNTLVDCVPDTCAPITEWSCDDEDDCTDDTCEAEGCLNTDRVCPDGHVCNPNGGACEPEVVPCFTLLEGKGLGASAIDTCVDECQARADCDDHPTFGDPCLLKENPGLDADLLDCIEGDDYDACVRADRTAEDFFGCRNICPPPPPCANDPDGATCDADGLPGTCESGECVPDDATAGSDFALLFQTNFYPDPTLTLFISSSVLTNGGAEIPSLMFSQPFVVVPGAITSVVLPAGSEVTTSDVVQVDAAVRVTSDNPIRIVGLNRQHQTTDAFTALPVGSLGQNYRVMSWPAQGQADSQLAIAATQDGTQVTITPAAASGARAAGVPYTITMNSLDAYQLRSLGDLTGTLIESDAPIAVFGGHQCGLVPTGYLYCDHLVEQMLPLEMWGTEVLSVPLATRLGGDSFRALVAQDATTIVLDGPAPGSVTLNAGEFVDVLAEGYNRITANGPILVAQLSNGTEVDGVVSDPFMMLLPTSEQFLKSYTFTTPSSGFSSNFVNIVALTTDTAAGTVLLDGVPVPASSFTPMPSSPYSGAQVPILLGTHALEAPNPLGMYVYGFAVDDSYGYSGGFAGGVIP